MESKRTMMNIGRKTNTAGQNIQHFMSYSPWEGRTLITAVQDEVKQHSEFQEEVVLILDESADAKAGDHSAGASRQHNGRLGKVEMSQVGVFLSLATPRAHMWIDGELYFPERWFEEGYAARREKAEIPEERTFQTKPELGWQMIQRVVAHHIPFVAVVMDDLYGRNDELRQQLNQANIEYYGDIPANTIVYLDEPKVTYPLTKRGQPAKRPVIVAKERHEVRQLLQRPELRLWETVTLRPNERGLLTAQFARCRVWTVHGAVCRQEWLLIRRDKHHLTYVLSNAPEATPLKTMASRKTHRYFIERDHQDAKTAVGWDEFQAVKYRAWEHQLALTILATWFIAETRLDWMRRFERDPALREDYKTDVLPLLSVGNVRELLRAAMPLPQLSTEEATTLVIEHLINRTRSRTSRLHRQREPACEM
ncbi:MAG: IS701 family transposase [Anaerolineae bacterium]|nr:IS701 family transposase [Anaerolineae bacterium]